MASELNGRPVRRYRRRTVRIPTRWAARQGSGEAWATTLGGGGMFLETAAVLPLGEAVSIRFRLAAGAAEHCLPGHVVWLHAPDRAGGPGRAAGLAIEFTDRGASQRLARELETLPGP